MAVRYRKLIWFAFTCLIIHTVSTAQELKFTHITPDDGLFSGNVRAFLQDHQGFIWIGTDDGLYRYDGYETVTFRNEKYNPASLGNNFVLALHEDAYRNLWIGTFNGGLSLYDRKQNKFRNFTHDPSDSTSLAGNAVRCLYEDKNQNLFIGSSDVSFFSLKEFAANGEPVFHNVYLPGNSNDLTYDWVSCFGESSDGKIWVGTRREGVFLVDPSRPRGGLTRSSFADKTVQTIFRDSKGRIWVGTWETGVSLYDSAYALKNRFIANGEANAIRHNLIASILEDHHGNIWIATDGGLSKIDASKDPFTTNELTTFVSQLGDEHGLLSDPLKALYFDRQNRMWVGSYTGGINLYDPNLPKFHSYQPNIFEPDGLSNSNISALLQDKKGRLWVGTDGGGLFVNHPKDRENPFNRFEKFQLVNSTTQAKAEKIKCLTTDADDNIWVGTWADGMFKIDQTLQRIEHFSTAPDSETKLVSNDVITILADGNDVWLGYFNGGVSIYNDSSRVIKTFTNERKGLQRVNALLPAGTPKTVLAAQEQSGVNVYSADSGFLYTLEKNELTRELTVNAMTKDDDGNLWLGSPTHGLIKHNLSSGEVIIYNDQEGLTNYRINAILRDTKKYLWISTNQGLFKFDPNNERFTMFTKLDGLQSNQYNPNSATVLADGRLIFGGIKGFDYFSPEEIQLNTKADNVVFTKFWLNDKAINVNDSLSPLKENIIIASRIELEPFQNSFSLEFAALDFTQTAQMTYQFIVDELNDRWQNLGSTRKVTFTDLQPGTYHLKVRALGRYDNQAGNFSELTITVHPYWWQTKTSKVLFIVALLLMGLAVHRIRLNYLLGQKKNLEKLVDQRTKELATMNNEVLAQNEELVAQNDQINSQRLELEKAQEELKSLNENLESLVEQRTQKLEETITRLNKALGELDRFVYSASHELGAPLKSILGLLNLAKLENDPGQIQKCHHYMELSITKLEQVIRNLVDFSRNSHLEVVSLDFDLNNVVGEIIDELKFLPEAGRVKIQNEIPEKFVINTDARRMKMIIYNLLSNSIKYADRNKPESYVKITGQMNGSHYILSVNDNGIGINPRNHDKIFNMFYRASDQSTGSGLGLFIVKEIVTSLGGEITVQSTPVDGTTFTVQLVK